MSSLPLGGYLKVEIAFTTTAELRAVAGEPWFTFGDATYGVWDDVGEWADDIWTDVTEHVWPDGNVRISRGRSRELDQFQTGRASFVLEDPDRLFDPTRTDPGFAPGSISATAAGGDITVEWTEGGGANLYAGQIVPMRRVRISAVTDLYTVTVFSGYITEWARSWEPGGFPRVTVSCVDGFRVLAGCEVDEVASAVGAGETTGARIGRVLDRSEVTYGADRDIDAGQSTVAATTLGANALQLVQAAAVAENGWLFVARDGTLTFRDRHAALSSDPTVSILCGPDAEALSGIQFHDIAQDYSDGLLFNRVVVSGSSGNVQVVEDADSIAKYLTRTLDRTGTILDSDDEAANAAAWLAARYAEPEVRLTSATVKLHDPDLLSDVDRRDVLQLDIGARVTVNWSPTSGVLVEQASVVEGLTHSCGSGGWTVTLQLATADTNPYLRWGDATYGVWGQNRWTY